MWIRDDGLFLFMLGPYDRGDRSIVLVDVDHRRRLSVSPADHWTPDTITWRDAEAIVWFRNSSSIRVPLRIDP